MIQYDPHDWRAHLFDIKGSMLREILLRVMLVVGWSAVVTVTYELWEKGQPERVTLLAPTVHTLIGTALGLLLVFRTNSSYDRFWEGRRMWGNIINESRNLARASGIQLASVPELNQRVLGWLVCFSHASMHALQRRGALSLGPTADRLPPGEVAAALAAEHVPLAVAGNITRALQAARQQGVLSDYLFVSLDQNVQLLVDYLGSCERIHSTPLPFAYMVHLRRLILLYCYTLPLALVQDFAWWTIPATLFVSYAFFGIEEIGVEIEDPFGSDDNDLPLERFCETIGRNVEEAGKSQKS